jgi:GNAT superfamily N-acetyltransferase
MTVTVRPMRSDDLQAVDRLWGDDAVPWIGAERAWQAASRLPARLLVAEDERSPSVAGYASYIALPLWRETYAPLRLRVEPTRRGEGIGRALWEALVPSIENSPVDRYFVQVDRDDLASRAIAKDHGGREVGEHIVSVLSLNDLPTISTESPIPHAQLSRPDLRDPVVRDRMYELLIRLGSDTPDAQGTVLMAREFFDEFFTESWQMLVVRRDNVDIALTSATRKDADGHIVFTGVAPDARGYGVARWLKVRHAMEMRDLGISRLRTENMADNAAILAVNKSLGYRATGGYVDYVFEPDDR